MFTVLAIAGIAGSCGSGEPTNEGSRCFQYRLFYKDKNGQKVYLREGVFWGSSWELEHAMDDLEELYREILGSSMFTDFGYEEKFLRRKSDGDVKVSEGECMEQKAELEKKMTRCWHYVVTMNFKDGSEDPLSYEGYAWCSEEQLKPMMETVKQWALTAMFLKDDQVEFDTFYEKNDNALTEETCKNPKQE